MALGRLTVREALRAGVGGPASVASDIDRSLSQNWRATYVEGGRSSSIRNMTG